MRLSKCLVIAAAAWLPASTLLAADGLPEGCRIEDGEFVCEDTYDVVGEEESVCRDRPWECLPSPPPRYAPPGGSADSPPTGPGIDTSEAEEVIARFLRGMTCSQLFAAEDEATRELSSDESLKTHLEIALYEANTELADPRFSDAAFDRLYAVWDATCKAYGELKEGRLAGEPVCRDRGANKPAWCGPPPPDADEYRLGRQCEAASSALSARLSEQSRWQDQKKMANANLRAKNAHIAEDKRRLGQIRAEIRRKKCKRP